MLRLTWLALITLLLTSCAHGSKKPLQVEDCVSDPDSGGFQCSQGTPESLHLVKFQDSANYIAHSPDMDEMIWDACLLQRKTEGAGPAPAPSASPSPVAEPRTRAQCGHLGC